MELELSDPELTELRRTVDFMLRERMEELVRTDDHAYRDSLREVITTLERLRAKLAPAEERARPA